jgi:hypothetical protein
MTIETKCEVKDESGVIPKGTRGQVAAVQWGDKKDGYVVDFPQSSGVYVAREDVIIITVEKVVEKKTTPKTHSTYEENQEEGKDDESKRKKEL